MKIIYQTIKAWWWIIVHQSPRVPTQAHYFASYKVRTAIFKPRWLIAGCSNYNLTFPIPLAVYTICASKQHILFTPTLWNAIYVRAGIILKHYVRNHSVVHSHTSLPSIIKLITDAILKRGSATYRIEKTIYI